MFVEDIPLNQIKRRIRKFQREKFVEPVIRMKEEMEDSVTEDVAMVEPDMAEEAEILNQQLIEFLKSITQGFEKYVLFISGTRGKKGATKTQIRDPGDLRAMTDLLIDIKNKTEPLEDLLLERQRKEIDKHTPFSTSQQVQKWVNRFGRAFLNFVELSYHNNKFLIVSNGGRLFHLSNDILTLGERLIPFLELSEPLVQRSEMPVDTTDDETIPVRKPGRPKGSLNKKKIIAQPVSTAYPAQGFVSPRSQKRLLDDDWLSGLPDLI